MGAGLAMFGEITAANGRIDQKQLRRLPASRG